MKVQKNTLYTIGIIFLVVAGIILLFSNSTKASPQLIIDKNQAVQIVKLSVKNGQYVLEPFQFKKDVLVRMEADLSTMPGCSKSIRIPSFDISKTFSSNDKVVEFIPDKAGTFNIACSMNMYRGTFTVLESDGTKPNYVEQKLNTGNSCGMGGGCGCGLR